MGFESNPGHRPMCPCAECDERVPAVPVVHPEPGDRADVGTEFVQQVEAIERGDMDEPLAEWEETLVREDRRRRHWSTIWAGPLDSITNAMRLADAEVAAAVAAVRADTAARLRGMAAIAGEVQGPFAQPYLAVPASSLETLAEELSS